MMTRKVRVLSANTAAGPARATTTPPTAGPTARAPFTVTLPRAEAAGICSFGTSSGWMACHAGAESEEPQPSRNVISSRVCGVSTSVQASSVVTAAAIAVPVLTTMSSRRRSRRSASPPASSARKSVGSRLAVCTRAMIVALLCRSTRNHWAPTVCIHSPTFETSWAMNRIRNTRIRSGAQALGGAAAGGVDVRAVVTTRTAARRTGCRTGRGADRAARR